MMLRVVNPLSEDDLNWAKEFLLVLECHSCNNKLPIDGILTSGTSQLVCTKCGCLHHCEVKLKSYTDHVVEEGKIRPKFLGEKKVNPDE